MAFMMIGERINGMFKDIGEAVAKFDPKPIQDWAVKQTQAGAAYLDLNVGPTAADRKKSMEWMAKIITEVSERSDRLRLHQLRRHRGRADSFR